MQIDLIVKQSYDVRYLQAECSVRYWEDAIVDGVADEGGTLIPCRSGDVWAPLIDLEAGTILNWPPGKTANIHYKVCDAGVYSLLDEDRNIVKQIDGYVPKAMCPGGDGYGDYVIMMIDEVGKIANWRADLTAFTRSDA